MKIFKVAKMQEEVLQAQKDLHIKLIECMEATSGQGQICIEEITKDQNEFKKIVDQIEKDCLNNRSLKLLGGIKIKEFSHSLDQINK